VRTVALLGVDARPEVRVAAVPAWARGRAVLAVLLLLTGLRLLFLLTGTLDLSPDEAHYWEWSRRLDWSYYSKGPLIAWLIALQTALFGPSMVGIRLGALLWSAVGAWAIYRLGVDAFDDPRPGALAAIGLELTPLVWAGSLLMTIDAPFLALWVLALLALHRALRRGRPGAWILAGLFVGLGALAKYTILFILPGLALYLARTPEARGWLRRRVFWAGWGVAALAFSPVLIWNLKQGWPSVLHVWSQGRGSGWSALYPLEFLASQAGVLSPLVAGCLGWALWRGTRDGLVGGREPYRFLLAFAIPVVLVYVGVSLQGKVQANWAAAAYPSLGLAAAGLLVDRADHGTAARRRAQRRFLVAAGGLALLIVAAGHAPDRLGVPARLDPTTRLHGWAELGSAVTGLRASMARPERTLLLSDQYQITSELAFYVSGHPPAYNLNLGRRLNQYDLWAGPSTHLGWDALYVEEGARPLDPRVTAAFERVDAPRVVDIRRAGRVVRSFTVYPSYGFRGIADEPGPPKY
jgi:4-amino-4-deoxy-L-arabinose transferase-like glycosyltransferase